MTGPPTFESLTHRTLEEHEQIGFFIDQLVNSLQTLEDCGDVEPLRRLAAQIESFRERLEEHFAGESEGGLFQAVLELLPDAGPEIHRLKAQHGRMTEILQMARIHAQRGEPCEAGPLKADLEKFLEMMRQHEKAEEALLRRALEEEARLT